ncbi:hypothetical protein PMAYCL1PPCAC_29871, partial [Pristionchus mayeri]
EKKEEKKEEEEHRKQSDKTRPPWRVSSPPGEDIKKEKSKDMVLEQLNMFPTQAFFEVGADSVPKQMAVPPSSLSTSIHMRGRSPRASTRERLVKEWKAPEKKEDEDLDGWIKRVTGDYPLKVNDYGKSFSSGLVLCALIHAYHPKLIGDFDSLDFSKTLGGSTKNVKRALSVASSLGVEVPDDSEITTPDTRQIRLLVERLRRILEGSTELPTPLSLPDHRISRFFHVNDDEKGVIEEMDKLKEEATAFQSPAYRGVTEEDQEMKRTLERKEKKQRSALSYDTFTRKDDEATVPSSESTLINENEVGLEREGELTKGSQSREAHDPFASSSSEEKEREEERREEKGRNGDEKGEDEMDGDATKKEGVREMTLLTPALPRKFSPTGRASQTRQEEYRKKAREMLSNPQAALPVFTTPPSAADERRREAARQLLADAQSDGATFLIHSTHHHHRAGSLAGTMTSSTIQPSSLKKFPSRTSLGGSATDLRRVELVAPSPVPLHKFKKRDPSPSLSRKIYDNGETPHVPAISASREDVSSRVVNVVTSFRRHGSMRADELKDLMYNYAQKYATPSPALPSSLAADRAATLPATPTTQRTTNVTATPTRKVTTQWEKDVDDEERTTREQETIAEELLRITGEIRQREAVIRDAGLVPGSEEEQRLVEDLVRLANEKNGLVVKEEYYNVIENLRAATKRFNGLKSELDAVAERDFCKTEEEKRRTDELMKKYMAEVEIKNDLMQLLFRAEEKMLEGDEDDYSTASLTRGSSLGPSFVRGVPVSASRRIAQGVKNWLQG